MATSGDASKPKFATANSAADSDYEVIAAVAGKKLRVIALTATALTTAGVVSLKSGAGAAGVDSFVNVVFQEIEP